MKNIMYAKACWEFRWIFLVRRAYFLSLYWLNIPLSVCSRVAQSLTHRLRNQRPRFNYHRWRVFKNFFFLNFIFFFFWKTVFKKAFKLRQVHSSISLLSPVGKDWVIHLNIWTWIDVTKRCFAPSFFEIA